MRRARVALSVAVAARPPGAGRRGDRRAGTQGSGSFYNTCVGLTGPIVDINDATTEAVDLIISAHTHVPYDCELEDPAGDLRPVTQAGFYGKAITDIRRRSTKVPVRSIAARSRPSTCPSIGRCSHPTPPCRASSTTGWPSPQVRAPLYS